MTTKSIPDILIIAGPTASGKSALALSVAQKTGGVIINADSQQLYRELRILTARPTPEEEALVTHKLYGILPAAQAASAGQWLKLARMEIDWARSEGKSAIVVGGTGLYLKALMQGIAEMPDIDPLVRAQASADFEAMGKDAFAARLKEIDPQFFARLKVYDRQRLVRAYEVWLGSGKTLSWWQEQGSEPPYPSEQIKAFYVEIEREELYRRCDARFAKMIEEGAVEEVRQLLALNLSPELPAMKSVGVREIESYLAGVLSLEEAVRQGQQMTRNYAKRQLTWLRHQYAGARVTDPGQLSKILHF